MIPWRLVACAEVPGGAGELRLYERGGEWAIRVGRHALMSSRVHGSEEALAECACAALRDRDAPRVLIGGLGMGYTLAATLRRLGPRASVVVAELVPAVVDWNLGPLASLAGHPLGDARVEVRESDVADALRAARCAFDAILLDVDNGPAALTRRTNAWLYADEGLAAARVALRSHGVLAVWSAGADAAFSKRLRRAGFEVDEEQVPARGAGVPARSGRGGMHRVWVARRGA